MTVLHAVSAIALLATLVLSGGCASVQQKPKNCPDKPLPFAKVMNPGYAPDLGGCQIVTEAEFLAVGTGGYVGGSTSEKPVTFMALPPGGSPEKNPLSGTAEGALVATTKEMGQLLFDLKRGTRLRLTGYVRTKTYMGGAMSIRFDADTVEKITK